MKEYILEVIIEEDGRIVAETKGMSGPICVEELEGLLEGLEGEREDKKKPEYYQGNTLRNQLGNKTS